MVSQSKLSNLPQPFEILFLILRSYRRALSTRPLITKSLTSGILASIGNIIAQKSSKNENSEFNWRATRAFALFGFFFSGPVIHYFLNWLSKHGPKNGFLKVFIDRFLFGPIFLVFCLYLLPRFEGWTHKKAMEQVNNIYVSALIMSWKLWIPVQIINLNFVPLEYQVLVSNLVSVGWNIYLSRKRSGGGENGSLGKDKETQTKTEE